MTEKHPITPPPDKIHNLLQLEKTGYNIEQIIALAAQWGADQELEACRAYLLTRPGEDHGILADELRAARRPKPLSLKEQALNDLTGAYNANQIDDAMFENIRCALEALPDD